MTQWSPSKIPQQVVRSGQRTLAWGSRHGAVGRGSACCYPSYPPEPRESRCTRHRRHPRHNWAHRRRNHSRNHRRQRCYPHSSCPPPPAPRHPHSLRPQEGPGLGTRRQSAPNRRTGSTCTQDMHARCPAASPSQVPGGLILPPRDELPAPASQSKVAPPMLHHPCLVLSCHHTAPPTSC
jgi:hypothetical protein